MPRVFRCPECRTRRQDWGLFKQHLKDSGHAVCKCGGYHHSHRKGSPYCYENPLSDVYHASRRGESDETLQAIAASIVEHHPHLEPKVRDLCKAIGITFKENHGNEII